MTYVNNDFVLPSEVIRQWFHITSENNWQVGHIVSDHKIVIHYFISYMLCYALNAQTQWEQSTITHFTIVAIHHFGPITVV